MEDFTQKYAPKTINDIVFKSVNEQQQIMDIVNGKVPFPTTKCGILLYGTWGTGKSQLAKLLPDAIELNKTGCSSDYYYNAIGSGYDGVKVITKIEQLASHYPFQASQHYIILDEVDRLKPEVMLSLKQVMNMPNCIFILTTNNVSAIDKGVLSRCVRIDFNAAPEIAWLPKVKRILADYSVSRTDEELLKAIGLCRGDAREILYTTQRIVVNDLAKAA
jgi:DNA polymerase III delta prime subunit